MTDRRPHACHNDRHLGHRVVTGQHRDDCPTQQPTPRPCPGGNGCAPCTAHHCTLCRTRHLDNDHPITCPHCIGRVRTDLHDILWFCRHLRWQATRAGHDGKLLAAAPIPGGDALVLYARAGAILEDLVWHPTMDDDHHPDDVVPVLLPLVSWDTTWRRYFGHQPPARPSVAGIVHYLAGDLLGQMAQATDGPDWSAFAWDMGALKRQLERVLHDESEPEQGVSCFECGERLVRKFGKPRPCRHRTPARDHLADVRRQARRAAERVAVLRTYPELGEPTYADLRAARRVPTAAEESAARVPCEACVVSRHGQGGIEDPSIGQSWECIGCRKHYSPGEYANAVRADLLQGGPDGDGWTHITMAAEAASTQTGVLFPPATVRKWMDRGQVTSCCRWSATVDGGSRVRVPAYDEPVGQDHAAVLSAFAGRVQSVRGLSLVYWPDVADQAAAAVVRHEEAERKRAERERERDRFYAAMKTRDVTTDKAALELGKSMGLHPSRVRSFLEELEKARTEAGQQAS